MVMYITTIASQIMLSKNLLCKINIKNIIPYSELNLRVILKVLQVRRKSKWKILLSSSRIHVFFYLFIQETEQSQHPMTDKSLKNFCVYVDKEHSAIRKYTILQFPLMWIQFMVNK